MPAPGEETADRLSPLQKQLILSQVQILELEDLRDELQAAINHRTKVFSELQTIADGALLESQESRQVATRSQETLDRAQAENAGLRRQIETLQRAEAGIAEQLAASRRQLADAQALAAAHASRIETLDAELRHLKASRSWRWSAPLRSLERIFR